MQDNASNELKRFASALFGPFCTDLYRALGQNTDRDRDAPDRAKDHVDFAIDAHFSLIRGRDAIDNLPGPGVQYSWPEAGEPLSRSRQRKTAHPSVNSRECAQRSDEVRYDHDRQ